jgi:hypothetical protein
MEGWGEGAQRIGGVSDFEEGGATRRHSSGGSRRLGRRGKGLTASTLAAMMVSSRVVRAGRGCKCDDGEVLSTETRFRDGPWPI